MVNFGKRLQITADHAAGFQTGYISYEDLKEVIDKLNGEPKATKDNENAFKDKLYAEIKRINEFYSEKEAEATELLDQVVGGEKNLEGDAEKLGDLVTRVRSLMGLNIMGVTKIVKKYKKTLVKKGFTKLDANDIIKKDLFPGNKITDLITRTNEATYDVVGIPLDALLNMQTHHFNQMDEKKDKDKPKEDKPKATWADWCMGIVGIFTWQRVLAILVAAGAVVGIIMGGQAISPSFMPAFSAATQAVCHVYVIICIGAFATWWGKFEKPARKGLNGLCKDLLLPCLLLAKVPSAVTLDRLATWWILPAMSVVQCILGCISGYVVSLVVAPNKNIRNFIMAVVTFPNTTSFPLTLVSAMFLVVTFDKSTTSSDEVAEATALILVYTTFMNIERWTVGYSLLMPVEDDEPAAAITKEEEKEQTTALLPSMTTGTDGKQITIGGDPRKIARHESMNSLSSHGSENIEYGAPQPGQSTELVSSSQSGYGTNSTTVDVEKGATTTVTAVVPLPKDETKKPPAMSLRKRLEKSFNAPSMMACLAIVLGCIPFIRDNIFISGAPASPAFTSALLLIGNAYLCGIFLTLGGNLFVQLGGDMEGAPSTGQIVGVCLARFVLTPGLTYGVVMLLWNYTNVFAGNKLMAYALMLEASGPTAVSLSTICQYFNNHEARVSILLLYEYAAVIVALTMWNTLYLMSLGAEAR